MASLILRLAVGLTFALAGLEKLVRGPAATVAYLESLGVPLASLVGPVLGVVELVAGLAILLGWRLRFAAAVVATEMLGILVLVDVPTAARSAGVLDAWDGLRLDFVLLLVAGVLAMLGPGAWSIDGWRSRSQRDRTDRPASGAQPAEYTGMPIEDP